MFVISLIGFSIQDNLGDPLRELVGQSVSEEERQALRDEVQTAIDTANAQVSRAESIREFRILDQDFTIAAGELTPTLKLRRQIVLERHADAVSEIYDG